MDANARPAIVIGGDVNGLGVVRSLAREGVPVYVLDRNLREPAMRTRFGTKIYLDVLEGEELVRGLLRLRDRFSSDPVLFLTQERSVVTVSQHLAAVSRCYRTAMPEQQILEPLMHKASFQTLAQDLGFPVPQAVHLGVRSDIDLARSLTYPCVLKPAVKSPEYDARFKKAYKVGDFAELVRRVDEISPVLSDLIVQEWIEGGDDCIYFCLQYRDRKAPVASFSGRKIRSWPPRIGGTASCLPASGEAAAILERLTNDFFTAVGFFGMGSMEYKRDVRTGRFLMIEPTVGRTDFQEEVATLNGVNIPFAAYCHASGISVPRPPLPQKPAVWAVSRIDRWSRELQPENGGRFPREARVYDAFWRSNDPAPWLYTMKARIGELLRSPRGIAQ